MVDEVTNLVFDFTKRQGVPAEHAAMKSLGKGCGAPSLR
jgi:hypothetical protein